MVVQVLKKPPATEQGPGLWKADEPEAPVSMQGMVAVIFKSFEYYLKQYRCVPKKTTGNLSNIN